MSEEISDWPQGCSTPITQRSRSITSSVDISDSQSVRLDDWSLDTDGIRLDSDVADCTHGSQIAVCSHCWSITSTVPSSSRPLFSDIDRTFITSSSDSDYSDADSELKDVFSEAVSKLDISNATVSTELSAFSNNAIEQSIHSDSVIEQIACSDSSPKQSIHSDHIVAPYINCDNSDVKSVHSDCTTEHFELNFVEPREYSLCGTPSDESTASSRPSTRASVATVITMAL